MDPRTHRTVMIVSWAIAGFTGLIWLGSIDASPESGSALALAFALLLSLVAAWVTWSRREWLVRHGELTWRNRFVTWESERSFRSARLEVVVSTDSDNDHHYALNVADANGKKKISSEMNDDADVVDLGRWLSERTGFALTLPLVLHARHSELRARGQS
jgi:hypothetical protein